MEIWKEIRGYDGLYQISNWGNVKSLNYNRTGKEKILKLIPCEKGGYMRVGLYKNKKCKLCSVHRLVYETFNGKIPKGMEVNHINEKKDDNRLENLNLMTRKENANWGTAIQRRVEKQKGQKRQPHTEEWKKKVGNTLKGKFINRENASKPVLQIDKKTNEVIAEFPSIREVVRTFNYDRRSISWCCNNKPNFKSAYGYKWQFKNG